VCYWGTSAQKPRTCPMWIPENRSDASLWSPHPPVVPPSAPESRIPFERKRKSERASKGWLPDSTLSAIFRALARTARHIQFLTGDRSDASAFLIELVVAHFPRDSSRRPGRSGCSVTSRHPRCFTGGWPARSRCAIHAVGDVAREIRVRSKPSILAIEAIQ